MSTPSRQREQALDELLVLAAQMQDAAAFERLVERWHPWLVRIVRQTTQAHEVEDVVQDVWLAVIRGLPRLQDPAQFGPWAGRIARNKGVDWLRRRRLERRTSSELELFADRLLARAGVGIAPDTSPLERIMELEGLRKRFDSLPRGHRAALEMHYLGDLSLAEIAEALELPLGTVKSRLFNARRKLRANCMGVRHGRS